MRLSRHYYELLLVASIAVGLSACGGGGSNGTTDTGGNGGGDGDGEVEVISTRDFAAAGESDRVDFTEIDGSAIVNAATLAFTVGVAPDNPGTLPANINDATVGGYFGAVDPASGNPDQDPTNNGGGGGPFWDGWTYIDSAADASIPGAAGVDGGLPGNDFHPLQAEIGGAITGAGAAACPANSNGTNGVNTVEVFGETYPICVLNSDITDDTTLTNDHVYVLEAAINVGDGDQEGGPSGGNNAVLTIQPGTMIFGYDGNDTGLVITRGSQIDATGTPDQPIIMAAVEATGTGANITILDDPENLSKRGQWAGLVLSGSGVNNLCSGSDGTGDEVESEAVPDGATRFFGCDDNNDNSGTVEYVIIAESGLGFRPDQEVQGLTLEAVGSGTTINYLQVLGSDDDGIEWFGGAVNASHVVINGVEDDSLDFDEGYSGTVMKALLIQGVNNGDNGIEADNAGPQDDATPTSRPNLIHVTILGNVGSTGNDTQGGLWKVGFGGELWRSVIADDPVAGGAFDQGCLDLDNQVDQNTAMRDVAVDCANGQQAAGFFDITDDDDTADGSASDAFQEDFVVEMLDEGA